MEHIVKNGKVVEGSGVKTIIHKTHKADYRVGLSRGWKGNGGNHWIITGYKKNPLAENFDQLATVKTAKNGTDLSSRDLTNSIPKNPKKANNSSKIITAKS